MSHIFMRCIPCALVKCFPSNSLVDSPQLEEADPDEEQLRHKCGLYAAALQLGGDAEGAGLTSRLGSRLLHSSHCHLSRFSSHSHSAALRLEKFIAWYLFGDMFEV